MRTAPVEEPADRRRARPERDALAIAAGLLTGAFLTWNLSNVGAIADPLAEAYGTSLAVVGLLTTALFVTHLASQLPAGIWSDRFGSHRVALAACAAGALGNTLLLLDDGIGAAFVGRLVVGLGSGAGFVAGLDLVRAGGGGQVLQGVYGAATMVGGGLALAIVPPLTDATSWRAAYASALVLALAAAVPLLLVRGLPRVVGRVGLGVLRDARLLPLGVLQAATFGLAVVAGNWVVPLLERGGASSAAAGVVGGLVLLAGVVTRPAGGVLAHRRPGRRRRLLAGSLVASAAGSLLLATGGPLWLSAIGALALGLASGFPFAVIFEAAQRLRPDAPGAAVALVNGCAVLAVLAGTPLAGLAFGLPGDGAAAFVAIATLALAALPFLRRLPG